MAERPHVVIAGGGIAGVEAALALRAIVGDAAQLTMLSPVPEFEMKPLAVEEPFTGRPADRYDLRALMAEAGGELVDGAVAEVDTDAHEIAYGFDHRLHYDILIVAIGARARPAYRGVETFWSSRSDVPVDRLIRSAMNSEERRLSLVVPPGTSWPLPIYELALGIRRRSEELGLAELVLEILTPEAAPLGVFGESAAMALADMLEVRHIGLGLETYVSQGEDDGSLTVPGRSRPLAPESVIALPQLRGSFVPGLPADDEGFFPVDRHGRVEGAVDIFAAGDGTNFPVKQGGLAAQQADAVVEQIALDMGILDHARPFEPILRGRLLTGSEAISMRHELAAGEADGEVSLDYLWWPPQKVAGRYIAAWLGHTEDVEFAGPGSAIEVEGGWPHEWHAEPL